MARMDGRIRAKMFSKSMVNLNQKIKEQAEPGVLRVIEWALLVHDDTMQTLNDPHVNDLLCGKHTLDEREEARKILLDYGAGKPTRIIEHRGNKYQPIAFETVIVGPPRQLKEPDTQTIEAEFSDDQADYS